MASRRDLQSKLEEILGNRNVYFQPPENLKLNFPCIIYGLNKIQLHKANNKPYKVDKCYNLTYIHHDADNQLTEDILGLFDYISHNNTSKTNNMYHDNYTIFY